MADWLWLLHGASTGVMDCFTSSFHSVAVVVYDELRVSFLCTKLFVIHLLHDIHLLAVFGHREGSGWYRSLDLGRLSDLCAWLYDK